MYRHPSVGYSQQPHAPPTYQRSGGPPPAKKPRTGGPIITRYPPPPGYRGPAQPKAPYTQPVQWQGHGLQQQPSYSQPSPYQQHPSLHPVYAPQHHPGSAYPLVQSWQQPPWQPHVSATQSATPVFPQPPPAPFDWTQRRHSSAPFASSPGPLLDGNGDPMPPMDLPLGRLDDPEGLEEDFDGECYFARHPDAIDPNLSLGTIVWKAPMPSKRAIPGTFLEAELEALAPRIDPTSNDCVSDYFSIANREERLLNTRQTEIWDDIKGDLIFKEFPNTCKQLISLGDLLEQWRNRFDPLWAAVEGSPTPDLSREPTPASSESRSSTRGYHMDVDARDKHGRPDDLLNDLEDALGHHSRTSSVSRSEGQSRGHSRGSSIASHHRRSRTTKMNKLPAIRDRDQEDILAALGVTGTPHAVYETPGPAFGPRPSTAGSDRPVSGGSAHSGYNGGVHVPSVSTIPEYNPRHDPSRAQSYGNGYDVHHPSHAEHYGNDYDRHDPSRTQRYVDGYGHCQRNYQHTADWDREPDMDATPKPKHFQRDYNRKRSYADTEESARIAREEEDEETPKQKSKQTRVY